MASPDRRSSSKKCFFLDMDGVVYRGTEAIPTAISFLNALRQRHIPFLLLTNHSCLTPEGFSNKLRKMGLDVSPEHIYSSSLATARWLKAQKAKRVFAIGEEGLLRALADAGIEVANTDVSHVVVGLDRQIDYDKLTMALRLIKKGAVFVGTNPDPTYPVAEGDAPECGLFVAAVESATDRKPVIIGKPSPEIYRNAAHTLGVELADVTMIGDRLDTDIAGAIAAGTRSILVLTGHTTRKMLTDATIQPNRVVEDLSIIENELDRL